MIIRINFKIGLNNFEMLKLLIEKGANVNAENRNKQTPLFTGSLSFYLNN